MIDYIYFIPLINVILMYYNIYRFLINYVSIFQSLFAWNLKRYKIQEKAQTQSLIPTPSTPLK